MKLVTAIVKPFEADDVRSALQEAGWVTDVADARRIRSSERDDDAR